MTDKLEDKSAVPAPEKSAGVLREEAVLTFWKDRDIFSKSTSKASPKGEFIFYEGPPTANGRPGIHHLESRAFKDAIPRYRTMQGYSVRRKAGWDTHGLPVEIEVEKKLGTKTKKDIEAYGIAKFNEKCKESVLTYIDEWKKFTDRIGYWVDHESTYYTFDNSYIESVWDILKTTNDRGLLYKDYKVLPWCPRCGTGLSSHEVAQGYAEVKDPSVYVKFELTDADEYFLAWTTTPWTLPSNVALAVGTDITYVKVKTEAGTLWMAKDRLASVAPDAKILVEAKGSDLVGRSYKPLYPYVRAVLPSSQKEALERAYKVYAADFVSTEDGTGIVHTAVMYGAEDFELGTKEGLPKYHLVQEDGTFNAAAGNLSGTFVKDADKIVIEELRGRELLYKQEIVEHTYPFCWRCKTPLIYYARDSWYIKMSAIKQDLIRENQEIHWEPEHIRDGRFGEWLKDLKDWAISRSRYWGTPLPIWECTTCKTTKVIGSRAELKELAREVVPDNLDLHRPYIDGFTFACDCGGEMTRVPEVLDVWFDSGAMPLAQDHYPFENKEMIDSRGYAADFICEAIDQTRGWFYTLHAIGSLTGKGKAYKNVICLGHILDSKGKKMSKSVGNIVEPWAMIDKYGVDALRYFMYTVNAPGDSKNFDERLVDEIVKKNFGRLNNVLAFYKLYAGGDVERSAVSAHVLDQWIVARLDQLVTEATNGFEAYQLDAATRPIALFIDDLSVWYLRRSRDRFKAASPAAPSASLQGPTESSAVQKSTSTDSVSPRLASGTTDQAARKDAESALATLRHVLYTLSCVLAPTTPFFAEYLYQEIRQEGDAESVHLASWPEAHTPGFLARFFGGAGSQVIALMATTRSVVTQALEARDKAGIKIRQPLGSLTIPRDTKLGRDYLTIIAEEINVKTVEYGEALELDTELSDELKEEGFVRELSRAIQNARKEAKLSPHDFVNLTLDLQDRSIVERNIEQIKVATKSRSVRFGPLGEKQNIGGHQIAITVEKI